MSTAMESDMTPGRLSATEIAPAAAGFSQDRLERITAHLNRHYIEPEKIAGCQVAVARRGKLAYFRSLGLMDRERNRPMADDTIFRIYSMTKPITSIALMQLYEQGMFQLNDPVHRAIPAWKDQQVYVQGEGEHIELREPAAPMTFRHLLSHTAGLSYGATGHPVDRLYRANRDQIVDPSRLHPGQVLSIPDFQSDAPETEAVPDGPASD